MDFEESLYIFLLNVYVDIIECIWRLGIKRST